LIPHSASKSDAQASMFLIATQEHSTLIDIAFLALGLGVFAVMWAYASFIGKL